MTGCFQRLAKGLPRPRAAERAVDQNNRRFQLMTSKQPNAAKSQIAGAISGRKMSDTFL